MEESKQDWGHGDKEARKLKIILKLKVILLKNNAQRKILIEGSPFYFA
jgi:hypothetical protein